METKISLKEQRSNMSLCLENDIKILPDPIAGRYKLTVVDKGKRKPSDNTYPAETTKNEIGAWDKLHELYKHIANNIRNQQTEI